MVLKNESKYVPQGRIFSVAIRRKSGGRGLVMDTYMDTKPNVEPNRGRRRSVTIKYDEQIHITFRSLLAERTGLIIPCVYRVQGCHADED